MKLFPFQQKILDQSASRNRVAYYLDMGLGKTFLGAEKSRQLKAPITLVICQKSKIQDWISHYVMTNSVITPIINLTTKKGVEQFKLFVRDNYNVIGVINYDVIFRRPWFLTLENFTLILDESSLIQNDKAKRTKFILKMNPANVILLSGTPVSGKYENLWSQLHLIGWNLSKYAYNTNYVNWEKINIDSLPVKIVSRVKPYKNIERLKSKMREHGTIFLKTKEVFELPEQTFIELYVSITKEYKYFQKHKYIKWSNIELIGDTTLTKRIYSRMLCGQYNDYKLQSVHDLIESTNDRLIIFYNFNDELDALKNIARKLQKPISEINGHVKNLNAYETEDNSVTFIQYQAGSKGLNLQKANKVIYFTPTDKCEDWQQSIKRIHRIGQNKPCFYYQLICRDSIEENIYKAIKRGVDYTDDLFKEG